MFIVNIFFQFPCPIWPIWDNQQSSKGTNSRRKILARASHGWGASVRTLLVQPHARAFLICTKIRVVCIRDPSWDVYSFCAFRIRDWKSPLKDSWTRQTTHPWKVITQNRSRLQVKVSRRIHKTRRKVFLLNSSLRVIFCKIRTSAWHGTSSIWLIFGM